MMQRNEEYKKNIIDLVESNFQNEKIAVIENKRSWTYKELGSHVYCFRKYLLEQKTEKVLICLPQSFYAYAIIWGAYLAKTTYCPIDTNAPINRKKYFIDCFTPDLIVTDTQFANTFDTDVPMLIIENFFVLNNEFKYKPMDVQTNNEVAYVIFTSGSTGIPKGVEVSRKTLENFVEFAINEYKVNSSDVWGQFSNLSFDLSVFDIFVSISCMATIIPIPTLGLKLIPTKIIEKHKITYWHSVPSVIDLINIDEKGKNCLQSLRIMNFAGETLYPTQVKKLFDANPNMLIYNIFGHTETTFCMYQKLTSQDYTNYCDTSVSIGKTIPNYHVLLKDIQDNVGEIVIIGDLIANGYINGNEKNAFSLYEYQGKLVKCFISGDYAYSKNENLFFCGRKDSQIKHKGNRIDLSEIDNILRKFGCKSSYVLYYNKNIIAFVICENYDENEIRNYLKSYLPEYYIPNQIICLDELFYNSSNKVDRDLLINLISL